MKIEIYGIDETDFRCGGCIEAKRILKACNLEFDFLKALTRNENDFPTYNLDVIDQLQKRGKFPTRSIQYPVIFIDDHIVRLKNLKIFLEDAGIDTSEVD